MKRTHVALFALFEWYLFVFPVPHHNEHNDDDATDVDDDWSSIVVRYLIACLPPDAWRLLLTDVSDYDEKRANEKLRKIYKVECGSCCMKWRVNLNGRTSFNSLNNVEANLFIMLTCGDEWFLVVALFAVFFLVSSSLIFFVYYHWCDDVSCQCRAVSGSFWLFS